MFPVIINQTDLELVVVGPLNDNNEGLILKTANTQLDLLGFANIMYNQPNSQLSNQIFEAIGLNINNRKYDYAWMHSNSHTRDNENHIRSHKILFAWKVRSTQISKKNLTLSAIMKTAIIQMNNEITFNLNNAKFMYANGERFIDNKIDPEFMAEFKNQLEWQIAPLLLIGSEI